MPRVLGPDPRQGLQHALHALFVEVIQELALEEDLHGSKMRLRFVAKVVRQPGRGVDDRLQVDLASRLDQGVRVLRRVTRASSGVCPEPSGAPPHARLTVAVWPWLLTLLAFLMIVTFWPSLSLALPRALGMM